MVTVHDIAYCRAGDKGDTSSICVFVYDARDWPLLRDRLRVDVVGRRFDGIARGKITRYELPTLQGLNFVLTHALEGGVSKSLRADPHGKTLASLMLDIELGDPSS